jgi:hypothetical protein
MHAGGKLRLAQLRVRIRGTRGGPGGNHISVDYDSWTPARVHVVRCVCGRDLPGKDLGRRVPGPENPETSGCNQTGLAAGTTARPRDPHCGGIDSVCWCSGEHRGGVRGIGSAGVATLSNITIGEDRMKTPWSLVFLSKRPRAESLRLRGFSRNEQIVFRESFFLKTREAGTALGGIA